MGEKLLPVFYFSFVYFTLWNNSCPSVNFSNRRRLYNFKLGSSFSLLIRLSRKFSPFCCRNCPTLEACLCPVQDPGLVQVNLTYSESYSERCLCPSRSFVCLALRNDEFFWKTQSKVSRKHIRKWRTRVFVIPPFLPGKRQILCLKNRVGLEERPGLRRYGVECR